MEIVEAQKMVAAFAAERAWDKNLPTQRGAHLVREVGRLCEHTLFLEGMTTKKPAFDMQKQVGDILFSFLQLANRLDVNVEVALNTAMMADRAKYPAEETKRDSMKALQEAATRYRLNPY